MKEENEVCDTVKKRCTANQLDLASDPHRRLQTFDMLVLCDVSSVLYKLLKMNHEARLAFSIIGFTM